MCEVYLLMGEERKMREMVKFSFLFPLIDYMALKLNNGIYSLLCKTYI